VEKRWGVGCLLLPGRAHPFNSPQGQEQTLGMGSVRIGTLVPCIVHFFLLSNQSTNIVPEPY
jgi:hypothetical protein